MTAPAPSSPATHTASMDRPAPGALITAAPATASTDTARARATLARMMDTYRRATGQQETGL